MSDWAERGSVPFLSRLERLLHREHHAILLAHRDLMTLPIDERVERGDTLSDLRYRGESAGGRISLRCSDNLAKFRTGDALRLSNGERAEGARGLGVFYESFDEPTGTVVVARDPFRADGAFDPAHPLQLDQELQSLTGMALEGLSRLRTGKSSSAATVSAVLEGTVIRSSDSRVLMDAESRASRFVPALDASQREAFVEAVSASPVTLVQGPPGTGKTYVLARIVAALAAHGLRVLVTAYTHRAVNNALRMVSLADGSLSVVKAGKMSGREDLRGTRVGSAPSISKLSTQRDSRQVVGATLFGLKAVWETDAFDVVVIDEAAQIPIAYASCAMLPAARFVLVGDHCQLGPIVQGRHSDEFAATSVFEHLASAYPPSMLRTTYRMNEGINDFPSRVFYAGKLAPEARTAEGRFKPVQGGPFDELFDAARPAVLALVHHEGCRVRSVPEARAVADIVLDRIVRQRGRADEVAVVSPFRAQLRLIRTLIKRGLDSAGVSTPLPVIDTVERIQGQEREMVVVSLVASDPDHLARDAAEFFFSGRRLNVTITRARTKLIVVASPLVFEAFPKTLEGLVDGERFRRLRRELPTVTIA